MEVLMKKSNEPQKRQNWIDVNCDLHSFPKSYLNKLHRLTERDSRLAHYFALFWGLGLRLGYTATSGTKI